MNPMVETVYGKKEAKLSFMCLVQIKEEKNTSLTGVKLGSLDPHTRDEVESKSKTQSLLWYRCGAGHGHLEDAL